MNYLGHLLKLPFQSMIFKFHHLNFVKHEDTLTVLDVKRLTTSCISAFIFHVDVFLGRFTAFCLQ